jgi:hypothetical protein
VQVDKAHYATNITGDVYESWWISEKYGYSFVHLFLMKQFIIYIIVSYTLHSLIERESNIIK